MSGRITNVVEHWTAYGVKHLQGKTIVAVRYLTDEEAEAMDWYHRSLVMQLSDGTLIFLSRDDEGNDAGALFGNTKTGEELTFPVLRVGDK